MLAKHATREIPERASNTSWQTQVTTPHLSLSRGLQNLHIHLLYVHYVSTCRCKQVRNQCGWVGMADVDGTCPEKHAKPQSVVPEERAEDLP